MVRSWGVRFRGPALALTSQAIGFAQLGILLVNFGANSATDVYFYLFHISLLPTQILTVGVLYPSLLNDLGIAKRTARIFCLCVPVLAAVVTVSGGLWLNHVGRTTAYFEIVVLIAAFNGAIQAANWHCAIAAQASGSPEWLAAVALPANAAAIVSLSIPWGDADVAVVAVFSALTLGNVGYYAYLRYRRVGAHTLENLPNSPSGQLRGGWWFFVKAGAAHGGVAALQSLAVLLPASGVTFTNLFIRIIGSATTTLVNAVLPRLMHRETESAEPAKRYLYRLLLVMMVPGFLGIMITWVLRPEYVMFSAILTVWLLTSLSSAAAQHLAFRVLAPRASLHTVTAMVIVVASATASSRLSGFDLTVMLCAYASINAIISTLLNHALRARVLSACSSLASGFLAVLWIANLA